MRKLTGYGGLLLGVMGIVMSLYHVYARLTPAAPDTLVLRYIALAFCLVLAFLLFPFTSSTPLDEESTRLAEDDAAAPTTIPWLDLGLAGLSIACMSYFFIAYEYITNRFPTAHPLSWLDIAVGTVLVVLVLEATRRTLGMALPVLGLLFIAYALGGPWLPGPLRHKGLTYEILLDQTIFTSEGLFGIPLGVAASYVILFIIFGAFLEKSGAGQFFMSLANGLAGGQRGGPGKVAVVSSSMFGTISGSAVANVMVDGWLTIPMMKRTGFKPEAAAAIEAVASTGGQIMPPVMGAASFVMAEFLGVPYSHVMLAAAIPAIFYYGALFAAIHFNASRAGLRGHPEVGAAESLRALVVAGSSAGAGGHDLPPPPRGLHGHLCRPGLDGRRHVRLAPRALGLAVARRGHRPLGVGERALAMGDPGRGRALRRAGALRRGRATAQAGGR